MTASPPAGFAFRPGERAALDAEITHHAAALAALVIAIDGPAASGKSSTARAVAERLRLLHVDTGAMYRALTLAALRAGVAFDDEAGLVRLADSRRIELAPGEARPRVHLDGEDVTEAVRAPDVNAGVSRVASKARVRRAMVAKQRALGAQGGVVMDGRDIGSVVFPSADVKVFLVADVETRAHRRRAEDAARGIEHDLPALVAELRQRDHDDSTRAESPLVRATDAIEIDTSALAPQDQIDAVLALALRRVRGDRMASSAFAPSGRVRAVELDAQRAAQAGYRAFHSPLFKAVHASLRMLWRGLFGLHVDIHPAARTTGSVLVACNHVGGLDPPVVGASVPFESWFITKLELFRSAWIAALIRRFNAIPIRRGTADFVALDQAVALLGRGRNVVIFPEGTRQTPGRLGEPRWGFGYVALRAGRPIVPVFVRGTRHLRPFFARQEPMQVLVGEPFSLQVEGPIDHDAYKEAGLLAMDRVAGLMLRSAGGTALAGLELPGRWAEAPVEHTGAGGTSDPGRP